MPLQVEYAVVTEKSGSFCDTTKALVQFLSVDSKLSFSTAKDKIMFDQRGTYGFRANSDKIRDTEQRYFLLGFELVDESPTDEAVELFSEMLKAVRSAVSKLTRNIELLRDDITFYYAKKGYELVHRIENKMRNLIMRFMIITLGKDWLKETRAAVRTALDNTKRPTESNALHALDFIHLSDFLFFPYTSPKIGDLHKAIGEATTVEDLAKLKDHIPRSNWKRYFAEIVDCPDDFLESRWKKLYELRCSVAHNALFYKDDYDKLVNLIGDIEPKLDEAIQKIHKVHVPKEELEDVAFPAPVRSPAPDGLRSTDLMEAAANLADLGLTEDQIGTFLLNYINASAPNRDGGIEIIHNSHDGQANGDPPFVLILRNYRDHLDRWNRSLSPWQNYRSHRSATKKHTSPPPPLSVTPEDKPAGDGKTQPPKT